MAPNDKGKQRACTPADPLSNDQDPVIAVFGYLYEALSVDEDTTPEQLERLKTRFQHRWWLASLNLLPEGFVFYHKTSDGVTQQVHLLTPPDMIAERDAEGRWSRRNRDEETDGPQPYTAAFYRDWLGRYELPAWFFRRGHLAMLHDTAEPRLLALPIPDVFVTPPIDYLEEHYPAEPQVPSTYSGLFVAQAHIIEGITDLQRRWLARRYPAVLADMPHTILALPSGRIGLQSRRSRHDIQLCRGKPSMQASDLVWVPEDEMNMLASYSLLHPDPVNDLEPTNAEVDEVDDDAEHHVAINGWRAEGVELWEVDITNGGGEHDQTGHPDRARYYSSRYDGVVITLDRSAAQPDLEEPHKAWTFSESGWRRWKPAETINWKDKGDLLRMKKWRDTNTWRSFWPPLRPKPRPGYSEPQRAWMRQRVKDAFDAGQPTDNKRIVTEFEREFGGDRTPEGISSFCCRYRNELKKARVREQDDPMQRFAAESRLEEPQDPDLRVHERHDPDDEFQPDEEYDEMEGQEGPGSESAGLEEQDEYEDQQDMIEQ